MNERLSRACRYYSLDEDKERAISRTSTTSAAMKHRRNDRGLQRLLWREARSTRKHPRSDGKPCPSYPLTRPAMGREDNANASFRLTAIMPQRLAIINGQFALNIMVAIVGSLGLLRRD
ncbi:hypothetical protein BDW60DRAFT_17867 [Aspergillus nidulans var. acristatus]